MLDFLSISVTNDKTGTINVKPDFLVKPSKDLMVRGGAFYAVWDREKGLWTMDMFRLSVIIDNVIREAVTKQQSNKPEAKVVGQFCQNFKSRVWSDFLIYLTKMPDNWKQLDQKVAFQNSRVEKSDLITAKLPYSLDDAEPHAFLTLLNVLYDEENKTKILWSIGSIVAGASRKIQKFYVLFGPPGTGKSTILNIIQLMFDEHVSTIRSATLTSGTNSFAASALKDNRLIAIDHEGDLSVIKDNTVLNSIVSKDPIVMDLKYQQPYSIRITSTLFVATNRPVTITDTKSGLIRRMIDIRPTGRTVSYNDYHELYTQISFELGRIANLALRTYTELGASFYDDYRPLDMFKKTNDFYNFIVDNALEFSSAPFYTLKDAWTLYKNYCDNAGLKFKMTLTVFRDEIGEYFESFHDTMRVGGVQHRSVFTKFKVDRLSLSSNVQDIESPDWLNMVETENVSSPLDLVLANNKAQYGDTYMNPWEMVDTTLSDIDTSKLHYVLPPSNMIVIDFDLKDENGAKSLQDNLAAARGFPPTYAELSKGGSGVHLHYAYGGDVSVLSRIYAPGIEVISPIGFTSIRRRVTKHNNAPVTSISEGLPTKGHKVINKDIKDSKHLRAMILRALAKEIHANTKPSVDFIVHLLKEAKSSGVIYDLSDMKGDILVFAAGSTNNATACISSVLNAPFKSSVDIEDTYLEPEDVSELVFFDVESFSNYLLVRWKVLNKDRVYRYDNPTPEQVQSLLTLPLIGFNNRRYDNHILYARSIGYTIEQVNALSQSIISGRDAYIPEAYNVSYLDLYDVLSKRQSLKEWEVDLNLEYKEMDIDWSQPISPDQIEEVASYCANDVLALEQIYIYNQDDVQARMVLSELSGVAPNRSTLSQLSHLVFGSERNPQHLFNLPDLSRDFPGYEYIDGTSTYKGELVGEGGYVFSIPGVYKDVLYLDVVSMHPHSIVAMNMFGGFTENYERLLKTKVALGVGDYEEVVRLLGEKMRPIVMNNKKGLVSSIKLALNRIYGYTFSSFDNPFRSPHNYDNKCAKRGALFMVDLKLHLQEHGLDVIHIKTDSVKIANVKDEDEDFVLKLIEDFSSGYGYSFKIEDRFTRLALIDDAQLVAASKKGKWYAVGATFINPVVLKTLFTKEEVTVEDYAIKHKVNKGKLYLELPDTQGSPMVFVGRIGKFLPVLPDKGGGLLYRVTADGKRYATPGTTGYLWKLAHITSKEDIDKSFYSKVIDDAIGKLINIGVDITEFTSKGK